MVTEPIDPLICPPATVTWTLVFGPEDAEGPCDQPGILCRSPKGRTELLDGWPLDSCLAWTLEDDRVNPAGCGKNDVVGRAAISELKARMGAWSACKASCLSWWRGVEHTWQQLTVASWLGGIWSCSNRKVAYSGSCGVNTQRREVLIQYIQTQLCAGLKLIFKHVAHVVLSNRIPIFSRLLSGQLEVCPFEASWTLAPSLNHFLFCETVVCLV